MAIFNRGGVEVFSAYNSEGQSLQSAYDVDGNLVFPTDMPFPTGDLYASSIISLPDIYNNGHGFTCTGLAYDSLTNTFLVGDIGKETPSTPGFASKIIRVSSDFLFAVGQIDLYTEFPSMTDVQGIAIDTSDGTIWFCSTEEKKIRHIDSTGDSIGYISLSSKPTGIAYSQNDDCFWVLTYASSNNIMKISKNGSVSAQYTFNYSDQLDQCFFNPSNSCLYITAGANYTARNNVYLFNTVTHEQSIACTVDSYSVEGIWIGEQKMVIVNDGYYHSAYVPVNQANIYTPTI